jgi:hypothetical protein
MRGSCSTERNSGNTAGSRGNVGPPPKIRHSQRSRPIGPPPGSRVELDFLPVLAARHNRITLLNAPGTDVG